ncbi:MAG: histidine phosphatase family protein [Actinomyces sp.]|uniref:histidine phosphatase family protein n=1 Tax=Actinomyces sp. TaxID=29317 RepID=UPI0026DD95E3|nr:histidine phosphatase family protein [Actinomyces sp.]MDO4242634.1 histidine phosphatase family protein [Actinomyces sp.]
MTRLVLWRHGQTDYNAQGRIQGRVDIPLNEAGLAQVRAAVPALQGLDPVRIFSSPLGRAMGTAEALAAAVGLPVEVEQDLVERSFGEFEGLTRKEMKERWPREYRAWRQGEDPASVGVEPRNAAAERVGATLRRIARLSGDETVVVVSHGASLTLGATHLLGMEPADWFGLRGLDNCRHALLSSGDRPPGWTLLGWNLG